VSLKRSVAAGAAVLATLGMGMGRPVLADQGGIPFWVSGQFASLAAVPQDPGIYLPVMVYYFQGSASVSKTFQRGTTIAAGLESKAPLMLLSPTYVPDVKIVGGRPAFSIGFAGGYNWASAELTGPMGNPVSSSDAVWGISDLYPMINLAWGGALNNEMVYGAGDVPVGTYDSARLANIGLGHAAADFGGGYTLLNQKVGFELSVVAGFTFNFANPSTNYKNGVDSHLDWAVSQFLSESLHLGVVGYLYDQLSGDSGSGDKIGSFESKVASVGGEAGYFFSVAGRKWYANARGYWEFWAENRVPGFSLFWILSIPLKTGS
jgi:hypothetical protein